MIAESQVVSNGYKGTEIGVIPRDWTVSKLGTLGEVIRGSSPRPKGDKRFYGGNVPRLMVEDITRDKHWITPQIDFLTHEGAKYSRPCKRGTLVVVCSGTPGAVGLPAILAIDACIHDGILALVNVKPRVSVEYLFHRLASHQQELHAAATHGGTFVNLTTDGFRAFAIPVPPTHAEQVAIATALSDADALIESLEQLLAKKRDLKKGAMQELLTGKRRLRGFRGAWETRALRDVGPFLKGNGVSKAQALSGDLPCVRYGEIYTRHNYCIKNFYSWISREVATTATRLRQGDILFAGSGETKEDIGKSVAFVDNVEAYAGGDIVILRAAKDNPSFLGYYLNSPVIAHQKASLGQGDAVVHISASALATIQVELPKLDEQIAIAEILCDILSVWVSFPSSATIVVSVRDATKYYSRSGIGWRK